MPCRAVQQEYSTKKKLLDLLDPEHEVTSFGRNVGNIQGNLNLQDYWYFDKFWKQAASPSVVIQYYIVSLNGIFFLIGDNQLVVKRKCRKLVRFI